MDASELKETSMNPEHSKLIRVILNKDDGVDDFMKRVFADDTEYRKIMIEEFVTMRKKA